VIFVTYKRRSSAHRTAAIERGTAVPFTTAAGMITALGRD
jgi:hypothetical protein